MVRGLFSKLGDLGRKRRIDCNLRQRSSWHRPSRVRRAGRKEVKTKPGNLLKEGEAQSARVRTIQRKGGQKRPNAAVDPRSLTKSNRQRAWPYLLRCHKEPCRKRSKRSGRR